MSRHFTIVFIALWGVATTAVAPLRADNDPTALPPGARARLGSAPLHIGYSDFTFAPGGRTIIALAPQGILRRFDAATGRLLERRQFTDRGDVDPLDFSIAQLSADGEIAAIYDTTYTGPRVTVYRIASGKKLYRRTSSEQNRILYGKLSPDGKQLAVVDSDNTPNGPTRLRVIDLPTERVREFGTFDHSMLGLQFSADGKRLVISKFVPQIADSSKFSLTNSHEITAIDLTSGKNIWQRTISAMNFTISRDGRMVVLASSSRALSDLGPGFRAGFRVIQRDDTSGKVSDRFVPWPTQSGQQAIETWVFDQIALAPDNRTMVVKHFDDLYIWNLRDGKEIRRFRLPKSRFQFSHMMVSPDGRTLLTNGEHIQRWDLSTGKPLFKRPPDDALPSSLIQLAFTPNGKELFATAIGGFSGRWNPETGKRIHRIHDLYGANPLIRTPDGLRTIAEAIRSNRFELTIFDPVARKLLHTVRATEPFEGCQAYTLTADGKTLLAIQSGKYAGPMMIEKKARLDDPAIRSGQTISRVVAWDVETGLLRSQFTRSDKLSFPHSPFSPCGRWVLLNGKLFHVARGAELFAPAGSSGERLLVDDLKRRGSVWFSADSRLLTAHLRVKGAKIALEDSLAVWDLASGRILARFPKSGFVAQTAFAPDGRILALLDAQGVRLMDLLTGKRLASYPAPDVMCGPVGTTGEAQTLVFSPDGAALATGHQDGSITLWKVPQNPSAHPSASADGAADALWTALGDSSPVAARTAIDRLVRHPEAAMKLLASRFRTPPADGKLLSLINDLDSDIFITRDNASRQLRGYGTRAESALRQRLSERPSLEMRRRIDAILAGMPPPELRLPLSGDRLRGVRAMEVLERIGNAEARKLLQAWADQSEDVQLAIEARLALGRIVSPPRKQGMK